VRLLEPLVRAEQREELAALRDLVRVRVRVRDRVGLGLVRVRVRVS